VKWIKKGLILKPEGQFDWVVTHAMLPIADRIGDDLYRIYFSGRDALNRSLIGFIEVNINEPQNILRISEQPVLGLGALGCFDDNGVTPTWIENYQGKKYLYYMGWNRGSTVRAAEVTGLAVSEDGGKTFNRISEGPILDRTAREPYTIQVLSCVLVENGIWRGWYDSAIRWLNKDLPLYNIKYTEAKDPLCWVREGRTCIDFKYPNESRISRACVRKWSGLYRMWYCYAIGNSGYRIGYGESKFANTNWERKDQEAGIDVSESGWDSEMVCYPFVFNHKGQIIMFYCGNGYGKTGFGYAILEEGIK
jgi:hypothetical protein